MIFHPSDYLKEKNRKKKKIHQNSHIDDLLEEITRSLKYKRSIYLVKVDVCVEYCTSLLCILVTDE
jgi:hypothetical protein